MGHQFNTRRCLNSHEICVVHHHWRFFSYRLTKQIWRLPSFAPIYQSKHKSYINSEDCRAMFKVKVHVYVNLQTSDFNLMGLQNTFRNLSLLVKWSGNINWFCTHFFCHFCQAQRTNMETAKFGFLSCFKRAISQNIIILFAFSKHQFSKQRDCLLGEINKRAEIICYCNRS